LNRNLTKTPQSIAGAVSKIVLEERDNVVSCVMNNATVYPRKGNDFSFTVTAGQYILEPKGNCALEITGRFENYNKSPIDLTGEISGNSYNMTILGDRLDNKIPTTKIYTSFSIGFTKQAINVISNVLDARDYLYRWIYAHHKVRYYTNFLVPVVATSVLSSNINSNSFPAWELSYDHIKYLDDAYIWTVIKHFKDKTSDPRLKILITQLLERKYSKSLYKSLAEYDVLFDSFDMNDKLLIFRAFQRNIDSKLCAREEVQSSVETLAGFVEKTFIDEIEKETGEKLGIKDLIWVNAKYEFRQIDPDTTYLIFPPYKPPYKITTLSKIDLFKNHLKDVKEKYHYFYLYYTSKNTMNDQSENIKQIIVKYFKTYIKKLRDSEKLK